ncbi:protein-glutamate methylesterase/protein-glutamine glutaminase [Marinobacterium aestuariivivens]|uniref:Protein-glutamate methylesterase/protein-glutamine glutaminase n=1 Tax=Marinobacterium aestuariivivens TaxID=1698799 RepID=A0ABW1ZX89_9GAMM
MDPIKVLIVDDSVVVRQVLTELMASDPGLEVVGTAVDPFDAREKIKQLQPDVLTLDIEMPRMDGLTFLRNLMRLRPLPVVMLSSLTTEKAEVTLQALELGAVDFMAKPRVGSDEQALERFRDGLLARVRAAAAAAPKLRTGLRATRVVTEGESAGPARQPDPRALIAIGASTGGTQALKQLLEALPDWMPPIVVTQHIPGSFSGRFARRLDENGPLRVQEAADQQPLQPGHVYIAPGDRHLRVVAAGDGYRCRLDSGPAVNRHRPSVEVMFDSLLVLEPGCCTAVMLTGMGRDGAAAMRRLRDAGARTLVQDEATSMVWGMPGAAVELGAAQQILPLPRIAGALVRSASEVLQQNAVAVNLQSDGVLADE